MVDPYQKGGGASGTFRSPDSLSGLFVSGASTIGEKNFIYEQMLPIIVAKNRRRALSDRQGTKDKGQIYFQEKMPLFPSSPNSLLNSPFPSPSSSRKYSIIFSTRKSYCI